MFFVVDVETSGLTPWTGELLTVGICPVDEEGRIYDDDALYLRLVHVARDPREIPEEDRTSTNKFWADQLEGVINEAYNTYPRVHIVEAREHIIRYVSRIEPNASNRFIAANPVAFDKMWLEYLYGAEFDEKWPFHYRALCLRSMRFGLNNDPVFGSGRSNFKPVIAHHGLYDAIAEAYDLQEMINAKQNRSNSNDSSSISSESSELPGQTSISFSES